MACFTETSDCNTVAWKHWRKYAYGIGSIYIFESSMSLGRDMHPQRTSSPCTKQYIHADYKQQLLVIFSLCVFLFICRVTYHPEPFKIGSLPLDINYSNQNTYVNMPIMTMLIFQTIFVGLNRFFN